MLLCVLISRQGRNRYYIPEAFIAIKSLVLGKTNALNTRCNRLLQHISAIGCSHLVAATITSCIHHIGYSAIKLSMRLKYDTINIGPNSASICCDFLYNRLYNKSTTTSCTTSSKSYNLLRVQQEQVRVQQISANRT